MGSQEGYYMVRAMYQTSEELNLFIKNSVVAVGWSRVNFSSFSDVDEVVDQVIQAYYSEGSAMPQVVGKRRNEVRRFKNLRKGDRIIIPYWDSVCLAICNGKEIYDTNASDLDLSNQRKVKYIHNEDGGLMYIPRTHLSEGLQRRLRVRGTTIADLYEFENEIDHLFISKNFSWLSSLEDIQQSIAKDFKKELLQNLRSGKTYLQTGGIGLENLIRELMEIEGYNAKVLSKRTFKSFGDADIQAIKSDRFGENKVLIQVKHHYGTSGLWGAEQLIEILNQQPELIQEYKLVLITSAEASEELRKVCNDKDISLLTGTELVDWIFDCLIKLSPTTKKQLGISEIPRFIL